MRIKKEATDTGLICPDCCGKLVRIRDFAEGVVCCINESCRAQYVVMQCNVATYLLKRERS